RKLSGRERTNTRMPSAFQEIRGSRIRSLGSVVKLERTLRRMMTASSTAQPSGFVDQFGNVTGSEIHAPADFPLCGIPFQSEVGLPSQCNPETIWTTLE